MYCSWVAAQCCIGAEHPVSAAAHLVPVVARMCVYGVGFLLSADGKLEGTSAGGR